MHIYMYVVLILSFMCFSLLKYPATHMPKGTYVCKEERPPIYTPPICPVCLSMGYYRMTMVLIYPPPCPMKLYPDNASSPL